MADYPSQLVLQFNRGRLAISSASWKRRGSLGVGVYSAGVTRQPHSLASNEPLITQDYEGLIRGNG